MKNIKYILSAAILSLVLLGCDAEQQKQEAAGITDESLKPIVSYSFNISGTVSELDETVVVVDITMDRAIGTSTTFRVDQIGGNAVLHEDYETTNAVVPAYETEGQLTISITKDIEVEGTETLDLQVSANAIPDQYEVIGSGTVSLSIEDYVFCLWTLYCSDTYGDGWNGGYVELVAGGVTTQYASSGSESSFDIPVTVGDDYSWTYVSGGGTGGGPGWESENYYELTAPDGTQFIDGTQDYSGIPTPGLITSGTSVCD